MISLGLLVRLAAKPEKLEELAAFLRSALPLVDDEPETVAWFAVKRGPASFAIFDVFTSEAGREAHLAGPSPLRSWNTRPSCSRLRR